MSRADSNVRALIATQPHPDVLNTYSAPRLSQPVLRTRLFRILTSITEEAQRDIGVAPSNAVDGHSDECPMLPFPVFNDIVRSIRNVVGDMLARNHDLTHEERCVPHSLAHVCT